MTDSLKLLDNKIFPYIRGIHKTKYASWLSRSGSNEREVYHHIDLLAVLSTCNRSLGVHFRVSHSLARVDNEMLVDMPWYSFEALEGLSLAATCN